MDQKFLKYLYDSFTKLVEKYGFIKSTELNEEGVYSIEYSSDTFVIKLEKYRREFYVALYKTGYPDKGVNLFNLLSYLNQTSSDVPESNYFKEEKDLDECYKKQFNYISDTIYQNFDAINDFFKSGNHELKMVDIRKFMLSKYPELFKRT
ncbi:hypothetical protein [Puia dinghuensis]|uniref:Uncharacterized protein n=1 Tax=Puia dinghuensis TaxID=1792502 RepID=A0A8J2UB23_9BACT|nr:hypothetical protein [Puia dinghuensis]GGA92042.1 hypothetical protein GCM10011511_14290 [Puia dinghuensis]